jgi:putative addiction module killer protein
MKKGIARELEYYQTTEGEIPFQEWFDNLADKTAQARILVRLERLKGGNPGDYKGIGMEDTYELRVPHGKGYRIYFGVKDEKLIILLCGGDKQSKSQQSEDITRAQMYWSEYKERSLSNE